MNCRICDASHGHIEQLEALERSCFSLPWTKEQLESQLPDDMHCFLIALDGDRILGYAGMMHVLDEGYISNVAVAPDARRRGIGDQLIRTLLIRSAELGLSFVTLEVRSGNQAAIRLYEKHGFQKLGLRKNYYDCPKEDAILMTKMLNEAENE